MSVNQNPISDMLDGIIGKVKNEMPENMNRRIEALKNGCLQMQRQMNEAFKEIHKRLDALEEKTK